MKIRLAQPQDCEQLARLCVALWPHHTVEELTPEIVSALDGKPQTVLPLVYFVAEKEDGGLIGFIETGLRSCANGCNSSHPVGFIEGWYVADAYRQNGIGRKLVSVAEDWARSQGCAEMASDALIGNDLSEVAHVALGYSVVERCVNFRKSL